MKDDRFPRSFRLFRPGHAVLCCRTDGSGFFSLPWQFAFGFLFRPGHAVLCCRTDGSGFFSLPWQFAFGFLFRPGHAVLCCRADDSGFFSLPAAVCLWLFVSSRSCGFVLPYRRFRFFQFIRGSLPLAFGRFSSACSFICRNPV